MPYTFIVLTPDRTDRGSKTVSMPKVVAWVLVAIFFLSAPITYFVSLHHVAPKFWLPKTGEMMVELESLREDFMNLELEHNELSEVHISVVASDKENLQLKNEAETRLALAENARAQSAKRVQELEAEILQMERQMAFYEKLVTPEAEEDVLQCFNLTLSRKEDTLTYGINFLKHDQSDKSRVDTEVSFSIRYGENMLSLSEDLSEADDRKVDMSLTKTRRLRGSLKLNTPDDVLQILDVRAYDKESGKVIAHCWQSF